jgi:hypothetical protein
MTASPSDAWRPAQIAALEAWRKDLAVSLQAALSQETTVEFLTFTEAQNNLVRRFVIAYGDESRHKVEITIMEPVEDIVERVLTEIQNGSRNTELEART